MIESMNLIALTNNGNRVNFKYLKKTTKKKEKTH